MNEANATRKKISNTPCPLCGKVRGFYILKRVTANLDIVDSFTPGKELPYKKLLIKKALSDTIEDLLYCKACKKPLNSLSDEELGVLKYIIVKSSHIQPSSTTWREVQDGR